MPPPQTGREGAAQASLRWLETPTMPGLESRFSRFFPWHDGHSGWRLAVTSVSNGASQSRHWYCVEGHDGAILSKSSDHGPFATATAAGRKTSPPMV